MRSYSCADFNIFGFLLIKNITNTTPAGICQCRKSNIFNKDRRLRQVPFHETTNRHDAFPSEDS
jgi:hypothetical protein